MLRPVGNINLGSTCCGFMDLLIRIIPISSIALEVTFSGCLCKYKSISFCFASLKIFGQFLIKCSQIKRARYLNDDFVKKIECITVAQLGRANMGRFGVRW